MLEFWLSKRNLMELISFPAEFGQAPSDEDNARFGLHRIDLERFLQVSPMVRGRESAGASTAAGERHANPAAEAGQHATPAKGEEPEEHQRPSVNASPYNAVSVNPQVPRDAVPEGNSGSSSYSVDQASSSEAPAPDQERKPIFGRSATRRMKK
jgi:hypothetical protein